MRNFIGELAAFYVDEQLHAAGVAAGVAILTSVWVLESCAIVFVRHITVKLLSDDDIYTPRGTFYQ